MQASSIILFVVRVITTCSHELDKSHAFCHSNFTALIIAGCLAPLFGIMNDLLGIRVNIAIGMFAMCVVSLLVTGLELYGEMAQFWFLVCAQCFVVW